MLCEGAGIPTLCVRVDQFTVNGDNGSQRKAEYLWVEPQQRLLSWLCGLSLAGDSWRSWSCPSFGHVFMGKLEPEQRWIWHLLQRKTDLRTGLLHKTHGEKTLHYSLIWLRFIKFCWALLWQCKFIFYNALLVSLVLHCFGNAGWYFIPHCC